ncbi:MAG: D-amino-acid transaminase [Pseudomonadota bacterium]
MGAVCDWAYLNGVFLAHGQAQISPFDRGFLFGDAVYEVTAVYGGRLVDLEGHLERLKRSLGELSLSPAPDLNDIAAMHRELVDRNKLIEGQIYLQVTRGAFGGRDFVAPAQARPTVFAFAESKPLIDVPHAKSGLSVISTPDIRWLRRDIKTTGLLAQALAKTKAVEAGAGDAWMVEDGLVTEGASSNAWIVAADGVLTTRNLSNRILAGITRGAVTDLYPNDVRLEERAFSLEEAFAAREAFQTSASSLVAPVVSIDGRPIADGTPGPITRRIQARYFERMGVDADLYPDWIKKAD